MMNSEGTSRLVEPLTEREQEVLQLLAQAKSNRELAEALVLSLHTVKWYNRQIYGKLGVENRQQAVARARELGLVAAENDQPRPPSPLQALTTLPAIAEVPTWTMPEEGQPDIFLCREAELAWLQSRLEEALKGGSSIVLVSGEAGSGKTALMDALARHAQERYPQLLVTRGICNALGGSGDSYLPFRDVLAILSGDVHLMIRSRGGLGREEANRLWRFLPEVIRALLAHGPQLVGTFIPRQLFLDRMERAGLSGEWLDRLSGVAGRERGEADHLEQGQLFEQYAEVLHALATRQPLLLLLDDLHWADTGSVELLFHLGRRLQGIPILIVGAYRSEEVARGVGERRHPLERILNEFHRRFGAVSIDLDHVAPAGARRFVDALVDSEPNRLGESFRQILFARTGGHPLFTVELLREMQARGDLVEDAAGQWVEGAELNWQALPARVEGVIAERIGRLDEELRQMLAVASVQGEEFTAQMVARALERDEQDVLRAFSGTLAQRHRLVRAIGEEQGSNRYLSQYCFGHALFQRYLYEQLSSGERRLWHAKVAAALEDLYRGRREELVATLAHHYDQAGDEPKAIDYSLQAGDRAARLYAHIDAAGHYSRALALLKRRGDYRRVARTFMKLGLAYHTAFDYVQARWAYDEGFRWWQRAASMPVSAPPPPAPHALRFAQGDISGLDPATVPDGPTGRILSQLFSGLVAMTPEMEVVPDAAERWEVLEQGQKYVFHLRDDVRWSDGTPVTARDFEYAWRRILDPVAMSPSADLFRDIKGAWPFRQGEARDPEQVGIRALDARTLLVELEEPASYFLQLLASFPAYPVPEHAVRSHGAAWTQAGKLVSNGPFRLVAWQPGESMLLERNPGYHGQFTGNVESLEVSFIPRYAFAAAYELYETDALDFIVVGDLTVEQLDGVRRHTDYLSLPTLGATCVGFDVRLPPFDDVRVRRAFAQAIDREALVEATVVAHPPGTGGFVPPGLPGHSPGIGLPYDPERARQLLAAAGYPGGRAFPVLPLLVRFGHDIAVENLQRQWRQQLGIEVRPQPIKWDEAHEWFAEPRTSSMIHISTWAADYPDPDTFLRVDHRFYLRWRHAGFERLLEQARRTMDQEERMKLYTQADEILMNEAAIVPLSYLRSHCLVKPWVRRFPISPILDRLHLTDVVIEPHS